MTGEPEIVACSVEEIFAHPSFAQLCSEAAAECADPELSPMALDVEFYKKLEASRTAQFFRCGTGAPR